MTVLVYYGSKISEHMTETPNGYLICHDVPIARTGDMEYQARDLQLEGDPDRVVTVRRYEEDVFEPAALASFEGKDITSGHPPEDVRPDNYAAYSKGHVENVRRSGDYMIADLHIKDPLLISDVKNGVMREVSCGYRCDYSAEGDHYKQTHIRGNHVAVVPRGRAGSTVSIKDAAQAAQKGRKTPMSKFSEAILAAFGMAAKDAAPEEMKTLVSTAAAALDADPGDKPQEAKPAEKPDAAEQKPDEKKPDEQKPDEKAGDEMVENAPKGDDLGTKLDKVIEMLGALTQRDCKDKSEESIDALISDLGGKGEAAASDAAIAMLKSVKPVIASIKDDAERQRVTDALTTAIRGQSQNPMAAVIAAGQQHAAQIATDSASDPIETAQNAYNARNPHMNTNKEDK